MGALSLAALWEELSATPLYSALFSFSNYLMAMELLFCLPNLARRPRFALRAIVLVGTYALALNSGAALSLMGFGWLYVLFTLCVFLASVAVLHALFDASWRLVFFYASAGYAAEGILVVLRKLEHYVPEAALDSPAALLGRAALLAAFFVLVWRLLVRRYRDGGEPDVSPQFLLGFVATTLVITNLFNSWARMTGEETALVACYKVACNTLLLAIQFDVFQRSTLERERELARRLETERERQRQLQEQNVELINIKCHDLKRQVEALRNMGDAAERERSISELTRAVLIYDSQVKTGNSALDTLLTEKSLACERYGIEFSCVADGSCLDQMGPVDVYTLFDNALDNAIEATRQVGDASGRMIAVRVSRQGEMARISVENTCVGRVALGPEGLPATSKTDDGYPGFGLKSIRSVVERYGGNMALSPGEGSFSLSVLLPAGRP